MRNRFLLAIAFFMSILLITACSGTNKSALQTNTIKEMVHKYSAGNFTDVTASINATALVVTDRNNNQTTYDLPEDEFFVSIAPFVKTTHPCAIHNLTGCQGELANAQFKVKIVDAEGQIVVDQMMTSLENGFIDLWLPRNQTFLVEITHNDKHAKAEITTFTGDKTCITTMQLF